MPRLYEKKDGDFIIRTYRGEPGNWGEGFHGTWQLHSSGMAILERHRLNHDGDRIPMKIFRELADGRHIWSKTGSYPRTSVRRSVGVPTQPVTRSRPTVRQPSVSPTSGGELANLNIGRPTGQPLRTVTHHAIPAAQPNGPLMQMAQQDRSEPPLPPIAPKRNAIARFLLRLVGREST